MRMRKTGKKITYDAKAVGTRIQGHDVPETQKALTRTPGPVGIAFAWVPLLQPCEKLYEGYPDKVIDAKKTL